MPILNKKLNFLLFSTFSIFLHGHFGSFASKAYVKRWPPEYGRDVKYEAPAEVDRVDTALKSYLGT